MSTGGSANALKSHFPITFLESTNVLYVHKAGFQGVEYLDDSKRAPLGGKANTASSSERTAERFSSACSALKSNNFLSAGVSVFLSRFSNSETEACPFTPPFTARSMASTALAIEVMTPALSDAAYDFPLLLLLVVGK